MSKRLQKFESYASHPMLKKSYNKLSQKDLQQCRDFIIENDNLSVDEFAFKTNRWMLDQPKPKRYSDMWALVLQSNTKEAA